MDIALIILDTARSDVVESLRSAGDLPNIGRLADQGTQYTDARANGPYTVPSHGAIFTGEYPADSGVTGADPTYPSVPLIEALKEEGYETGAFSANPWLSPEFGFADPFDMFLTKYDRRSDGLSMAAIMKRRGGPRDRAAAYLRGLRENTLRGSVENTALWAYQRYFREDSGGNHLFDQSGSWLARGDQPRFAFVNVTEPHLAYELPTEWLPDGISQTDLDDLPQDAANYNAGVDDVSEAEFEQLRAVYESTLKYTDHLIGKFIATVDDETTIIVAGDHGEHFGEHGRFGHQYSLHRELLHVPLVIDGPDIDAATVDQTVELRGLYEYLLALASGGEASLPECQYHIAELVTPRPTPDELDQRPKAAPREFIARYRDGARCITSSEGILVEFPDGETVFHGAEGQFKHSQNLEEDLQTRLEEKRGPFQSHGRSELNVSESVEARLEELGYR